MPFVKVGSKTPPGKHRVVIQFEIKAPIDIGSEFQTEPLTNTTDLYWGQSKVSRRGRHKLLGEGYNFPGGADARQIYLFAKGDIKVEISLRSR